VALESRSLAAALRWVARKRAPRCPCPLGWGSRVERGVGMELLGSSVCARACARVCVCVQGVYRGWEVWVWGR